MCGAARRPSSRPSILPIARDVPPLPPVNDPPAAKFSQNIFSISYIVLNVYSFPGYVTPHFQREDRLAGRAE
jgi:hypothetical protein